MFLEDVRERLKNRSGLRFIAPGLAANTRCSSDRPVRWVNVQTVMG